MTRHDSWTANWVCDKLIADENIIKASPVNSNLLLLCAKEIDYPVKVASISVNTINSDEIQEVYQDRDIEFIMNIKKDVLITKDALEFSESISVGLGGLGDLYVAVNERNFREYLPKETRFILRGLRQHTNVEDVERMNNRKYKISRCTGSDLVILALNDYDLSADSVRSGLDKFGECDIILTSNPNCIPSIESKDAAKHCGVKLFGWGGLLGAINY
ncbi:MAG: hypothetical protein F6K17_09440 [Okeania sp. SIO3C4]|nr:hypothetical protein [Okeania sp. SIO3C4]